MRQAVLILLCLAAPLPALAYPPTYATGGCDSAIQDAQLQSVLPPGLLQAVALVESGRSDPRSGVLAPWPWTINVGGQGYFFASKAAAIKAVQELRAADITSIDVGCMQINLSYHPAAFRTLQQAFDPRANARYAVQFLTELYDRSLDWTKAVGAYHSQTPTIAGPYEKKVLAHWLPPAGTHPQYADFLPASQLYRGAVAWEDVYKTPRSWEQMYGAEAGSAPARGGTRGR